MTDSPTLTPTPIPQPDALPELTERQETILSLVVREYVRDAQPVGSKSLVERFNLDVSSATVRNDMGILEEYGLIYAPHTSAGRVPTQQGYRYFVRRLLTGSGLTTQERRHIDRVFHDSARNVDEWPRLAAMALARTAHTAALATPPRAIENHFKHLELISTQGRLVLMVLVVQGGSVHQQMLTLAEPVQQDTLSRTAAHINQACAGLTVEQVRARARSHSDELTRDIGELVADAMQQTNQQTTRDIFRYGLSENLPSFSEHAAQQVMRVLEEEDLLDTILQETLASDQPEVRIVVAGEGRWEDLSHLSMV
ncbi:MAG: heat-inducible transcription repressor HrcA, partial [Anaerolineae bacterium]|nr:heat-inducible transcription repressor HrcA [Anaerolineae bacterium]